LLANDLVTVRQGLATMTSTSTHISARPVSGGGSVFQ
jgi:hypothetical protein